MAAVQQLVALPTRSCYRVARTVVAKVADSSRAYTGVVRARAPASSFGLWRPRRGFQRREYGLDWYRSKEELLIENPGAVLVGSSYEYEAGNDKAGTIKQAKKYASFPTHYDFWDCVSQHEEYGMPHNLHEVFPENAPRSLYFDLDGDPGYWSIHSEIMSWLRLYVRWFFNGDRLGWDASYPNEVVLSSANPTKYSCHVVFPQIQFANFEQQSEYMQVLLNGLPALKVELEGGESVPILERVVDRVPYTRFQLFRGPFACKLALGELKRETRLEPESFFRGDPMSCFAGRAEPHYALPLPSITQLLDWNEELRYYNEHRTSQVMVATEHGPRQVSLQDFTNLYDPAFQRGSSGGVIDFAGLTPLEQYEMALQWLHPNRASQWWSWFRISGVTYTMLERYADDEAARQRIWKAHFAWSRSFKNFDEDENVEKVTKSRGRRVSGLPLLLNLVRFDNPGMQVRTSTWQFHVGGADRGARGPRADAPTSDMGSRRSQASS